MPRLLRIAILTLALVAAATSWPRAQSGAAQKPPDAKPAAAGAADAQKPAEPAQELPADAKAFNAAAGERNPLKRVEALEKFIADNPKSTPACQHGEEPDHLECADRVQGIAREVPGPRGDGSRRRHEARGHDADLLRLQQSCLEAPQTPASSPRRPRTTPGRALRPWTRTRTSTCARSSTSALSRPTRR